MCVILCIWCTNSWEVWKYVVKFKRQRVQCQKVTTQRTHTNSHITQRSDKIITIAIVIGKCDSFFSHSGYIFKWNKICDWNHMNHWASAVAVARCLCKLEFGFLFAHPFLTLREHKRECISWTLRRIEEKFVQILFVLHTHMWRICQSAKAQCAEYVYTKLKPQSVRKLQSAYIQFNKTTTRNNTTNRQSNFVCLMVLLGSVKRNSVLIVEQTRLVHLPNWN